MHGAEQVAKQHPSAESVIPELQMLRALQGQLEEYTQHAVQVLKDEVKPLEPEEQLAPQKLRELAERLEAREQQERPAGLAQLIHVGELQELMQLLRIVWDMWPSRDALALLRRLEHLEQRVQPHRSGVSRQDYATDFAAWAQQQAVMVRLGHWEEIDQEHLAEELEALSRSEHDALESRLEILTTHLLKWRFDTTSQDPRRLWRLTIREQRRRIARLLHRSPSLRPTLPDVLHESYPHARFMALDETDLPETAVPQVCPWPVTQILDDDFLPDALS